MESTTNGTAPGISPEFAEKLAEHKRRAAQARAEIGDVDAALSALLRNMFSAEAFAMVSASMDEALDEDVEEQGGR